MAKSNSHTPLLHSSSNTSLNNIQDNSSGGHSYASAGNRSSTPMSGTSYHSIMESQYREMESQLSAERKSKKTIFSYLQKIMIALITISFVIPVLCLVFSVRLTKQIEDKYGDRYLEKFVENSTSVEVQDIKWHIMDAHHIQLNVSADVQFNYSQGAPYVTNLSVDDSGSFFTGLLPKEETMRKIMKFSMNHAVKNMCVYVDNIEVVGGIFDKNGDENKMHLGNITSAFNEMACFSVRENDVSRVHIPVVVQMNWTNMYKIAKAIRKKNEESDISSLVEVFTTLDMDIFKKLQIGEWKLPILKNLHVNQFDITKFLLKSGENKKSVYFELFNQYLRLDSEL